MRIGSGDLLLAKALRLVKIMRVSRLHFVTGTPRPFPKFFRGFENVEAVRRIFGDRTEEVLRDLKVEFMRGGGYMGVSPLSGNLMVSPRYLNEGDKIDIYLDVIHELVHVRQFMEGKDLFDSRYRYVERPTEIEAYRHAVEEARRIGLSDARICEYLSTEWLSGEDLERLARVLGLRCEGAHGRRRQRKSLILRHSKNGLEL